jgi:1,4-dihydroxy-2-naphthoate octaprenyltransferase
VLTLLALAVAARALATVRAGAVGPALIPVLRDTGLTMLVWAIAVALALALG